jgi:hypothetical protein
MPQLDSLAVGLEVEASIYQVVNAVIADTLAYILA